ncbi:helix-turn-helix domain-containing protein [Acinetobacter guillouiae]|jgi:transposase|uniref:helix-turn-helix domain-containing protein n=1 Tax=Acinetobacter guillouiae TaxID=106649 RepID=UPI0028D5A267|nr:helix-turn-helix domain-containing protein [Acinetobacter guillouiae]
MAKYSQEFKLKVVEHYLSGHGDSVTGQIFNVHRSDVEKWSKAFKLYGMAVIEADEKMYQHKRQIKVII